MSGATPRAQFRFVCPLPNGMHARPASLLADAARGFQSVVRLTIDDSAGVDVTSVLSVVALDVRHAQECTLIAEGDDASVAIHALARFVTETLPSVDTPTIHGRGPESERAVWLSPVLMSPESKTFVGVPAVGGIGFGEAVHVAGFTLSAEALRAVPCSVADELGALHAAVEATRESLTTRARGARGVEAELLRAHMAIATDTALSAAMETHVRGGATAIRAVFEACEGFAQRLRSAESEYIRERASDVGEVGMLLMSRLPGGSGRDDGPGVRLGSPSVILGETLTSHQLMSLDREHLHGLVLGGVGRTSHVVILARSFGIPTVVGMREPRSIARAGEEVIVDGEEGRVFVSPAAGVRGYFERERNAIIHGAERTRDTARGRVCTIDGQSIEVGVNAASEAEVHEGVRNGADGVGLVRTEFLFLDRNAPPNENEQFETYSSIVRAAEGRPVLFRTIDIGGDKPVAYMRLPREENPFLGVRGLRLYATHEELLRTQLRAMLRAATLGSVKIMAPMVSTPTEASWFRDRVDDAQRSLERDGVHVGEVSIGMMIEVPSATTVMDQFCRVMDFFSIGTNDLCQYWSAADRGNAGVASLGDARQPSFVRLLRGIVREARRHGRWIGVCGEMAGDAAILPLMVGLGVDEISVAPTSVGVLKSMVLQASGENCQSVLEEACGCEKVSEVAELLARPGWRGGSSMPIVDPSLVAMRSEATTKAEAIHEAACVLRATGRLSSTRPVEQAAWAREETYSTGLGHGFAIPHCKSEAVVHPSLAIVRLATPIEWGSLDEQPVSIVMLLVVPSSDSAGSHMKIFARLARRLMHESFRDRLRAAESAEGLVGVLREELELS
ncbi:MAG: phosphoenolpyruvate--protein phosphotransferase [Phycisphaerales bacterium]|nr:MAG: phosphoenolpyruvate--protein phosphotransferase [Phycisphaerales bacterium]